MGFLAGLYTLLLVAICLLQALLLYRTGKPAARQDDEALKEWLRQQLEAQARVLEEKQAQQAQQNLAAMAHISDTLQTAVQGMSSTLTAGQNTQQQTMEQRLQGLEASNARKLEEMRKALADGLAAMQAQNAQKLDEIRHTVDEQLQDALQKRVTESFKAVNDQLEQVYKGLGEMQSLAADVGGLKQVLSGVKTRGILGEIQLGAILAVVVLYWSKLWPFYIREISPKKRKELNRMNPVSRMALTFVEKFCNKDKWILWFKILVACIPTIVIALPFNDIIEEKFNNYVVVAIALIVYGVIFILIENYNKRRKPVCTSLEELSFGTAFKIGIFQVLSVIPGTSRSGSTIIGGILVGTSRTVAAEFTFFLAIPVMFGASLLKLVKFGFAFTPAEILTLVTGVVVAFFVSVIAIKFLMGYIKKHDFKAFGWYRIVLGILVLGYFAVAVHR